MKYMGSKSRLARHILPIILKDRARDQPYVEPFAGGMNMIQHVDGFRIANDANTYLASMWNALLGGWVPPLVTKEEYTHIRDNKHIYPDYVVGWVGFNCSYSGKWFGGYAGVVRTKAGTIRDYQQEAHKNLQKQLPYLRGIYVTSENYSDLPIPNDSIIYCDPPYKDTTKYAGSFDHDTFYEWVKNMKKAGHTVYVSEYHMPEDDFQCIWEGGFVSSLSANGKHGGSKKSVEKLFICTA